MIPPSFFSLDSFSNCVTSKSQRDFQTYLWRSHSIVVVAAHPRGWRMVGGSEGTAHWTVGGNLNWRRWQLTTKRGEGLNQSFQLGILVIFFREIRVLKKKDSYRLPIRSSLLLLREINATRRQRADFGKNLGCPPGKFSFSWSWEFFYKPRDSILVAEIELFAIKIPNAQGSRLGSKFGNFLFFKIGKVSISNIQKFYSFWKWN